MSASPSYRPSCSRAVAALALLALGAAFSGCAQMGDSMSSAFADPARYDLYECKQLEPERVRLVARKAELQALMTKAETGVGGSVVSELAYRNEYIATQGQTKLAEEAWQRNKCQETKPEAKPAAAVPSAPTPIVRGSGKPLR